MMMRRQSTMAAPFIIGPPKNPESRVTHSLKIVRSEIDDKKRLVNDFIMLHELGSGSFGKVRMCENRKTHEKLALKIMSKSLLRKKRDLMPTRSRSSAPPSAASISPHANPSSGAVPPFLPLTPSAAAAAPSPSMSVGGRSAAAFLLADSERSRPTPFAARSLAPPALDLPAPVVPTELPVFSSSLTPSAAAGTQSVASTDLPPLAPLSKVDSTPGMSRRQIPAPVSRTPSQTGAASPAFSVSSTPHTPTITINAPRRDSFSSTTSDEPFSRQTSFTSSTSFKSLQRPSTLNIQPVETVTRPIQRSHSSELSSLEPVRSVSPFATTSPSASPRAPRPLSASPSAPPMLNQFASTALDKVKREIEIMQDLIHPNVLQLREVLLDEHDDKLYMVLDLCEGGELMSWDTKKLVYTSDVFSPMACQAVCSVDATATRPAASLGGLPLNFVKYLIYQAIDALEYVHSCGVVHRDIKPENCFLHVDGSLRLGDFGVAFQFDNDDDRMMSDSNGTYAFMAPEQCGGMEYDAFMADVWALGVTAYALVYGRLPHFSDNTATMFESIQSGIIAFPDVEPRAEAEQAKAFLLQILARNPMDRAGLLQLKEHPWLHDAESVNLAPYVRSYVARTAAKKAASLADDFDYDSD